MRVLGEPAAGDAVDLDHLAVAGAVVALGDPAVESRVPDHWLVSAGLALAILAAVIVVRAVGARRDRMMGQPG